MERKTAQTGMRAFGLALAVLAIAMLAFLQPVQSYAAELAAASKSPANASPSVRYRVNLQESGWSSWTTANKIAGDVKKHERVVGFAIQLDAGAYEGGIRYRARLKSGRWKAWRYDGREITSARKIEAIQIELTGDIAQTYDVVYQAYVQGVGWQRRMRNGEAAGTTGRNLRIESIRVALVSKRKASGWIGEYGSWSYYRSGKRLSNTWVDTKESPIDEALKGTHRYWIDANGALATNRFINPRSSLDSRAKYAAYAGASGYVETGKVSTYRGTVLAGKNGKLYSKGGWLTTKAYDGSKQRYRMVRKGTYSVVKTGLFRVGTKKYYAWEDGRGYLMRSTIWWVAGHWYKANSKGALRNYDSKTTKHIERYVKWAVKIAKDDSHGYSQADRWGPDYDCSSLVCSALLASGFADSGASWTGNMKAKLKKIGFVWHKGTSGLRRGDIMLVHSSRGQHTEIYIGSNRLVGAHIAETGRITGKTGDQTGNEISVRSYYDYPWQGYLRYKG